MDEKRETYLTVEELADMLKVCVRTVATWDKQGRIPCIRLSRRCHRYKLSDVEKLLEEMTVTNKQE